MNWCPDAIHLGKNIRVSLLKYKLSINGLTNLIATGLHPYYDSLFPN